MRRLEMDCVGRKQHRWDRAVYTDYDARRRRCIDCGMTGAEWQIARKHRYDQTRWWASPCACGLCREGHLRRIAIEEQAFVKAALRRDEEEVLALYGRSDYYRLMFQYRTPEKAREEYPAWQFARTERAEKARQRRYLRKGRETLTAIRRHLRGQDRLPQPESRPAKTSQT